LRLLLSFFESDDFLLSLDRFITSVVGG